MGSDSEGDTVVCVDVMHLMKRIPGRRTKGKLNNSRVFDKDRVRVLNLGRPERSERRRSCAFDGISGSLFKGPLPSPQINTEPKAGLR